MYLIKLDCGHKLRTSDDIIIPRGMSALCYCAKCARKNWDALFDVDTIKPEYVNIVSVMEINNDSILRNVFKRLAFLMPDRILRVPFEQSRFIGVNR